MKMISNKLVISTLCVVVVLVALTGETTEARYLPTRGKMDRLDKLRELLKELLASEIEKEEYQADAPPRWHPEQKLFYKREASINKEQH